MTVQEMIVKSRRQVTGSLETASRPFRGIWPSFPEALLGMVAMAVIAFVLLTYSTTVARATSEFLSGSPYLALLNGMLNPFRSQHLLTKSGLPVYDIKIKHREYAKIEAAVAEAKKQGWMEDDQKVWANAKFIYDGQEYNVKIRVRGDLPAHWEGPKKSWRIKFGNEKVEENGELKKEPIPFESKRQINLIIPNDRDYILSYFVNDLLHTQGLVTLRDRFAVLRINGTMQGLYYEVEHFDKPVFASQMRPETTVFGQNDRAMHFEQYTKLGMAGAADARYDIGSQRQLVEKEDDLSLRAMEVLLQHSRNPTPENFQRVRALLDWDKYLRLKAITTLCNTNHAKFGSDNLRLYYDPSRGLLEPIPWDLHLVRMPTEPGTIDYWNTHGPDELERATLTDPELRLQRNRILWGMVGDGGDRLLKKYAAIHERIRPLAWADVLATPIQGYKMDALQEIFMHNVRRVHKVLALSSANLSYRLDTNRLASLDFATTNFSGVQLNTLELNDPDVFEGDYQLHSDANHNRKLDADDPVVGKAVSAGGRIQFTLNETVLPEVKFGSDIIEARTWQYYDTMSGRRTYFLAGRLTTDHRDPIEWRAPEIKATGTNPVSGKAIASGLVGSDTLPADTIGVTAYDASDFYDLMAPERGLEEFLRNNPQFRRSVSKAGAVELGGRVQVSGTVIVPKAVSLILTPGTDLTMMPNASIVAYGGFGAVGTSQQPIRVHGIGNGQAWGVIGVVRPPEKVVVRHLEMQEGGQAQINGILFTGGFAIYDADLEMEDTQLTNMHSEDGLNVKRGKIWIRNSIFQGGWSDAVDLDFATGEVRDSLFLNNKGDGIDLSGSRLLIAGNRFEGMGDKGISIGEDSHPIIINNLLKGNQIGISTKDHSQARVAYSTFVENVLAIEAKRKKPMFGGAGGEFVDNVFTGNKKLLSEDHFSQGRVVIRESLTGEPAQSCTGCTTQALRFVAMQNADYRIAPDVQVRFSPVKPAWIPAEISDGKLPALPGIFSKPPTTKATK